MPCKLSPLGTNRTHISVSWVTL